MNAYELADDLEGWADSPLSAQKKKMYLQNMQKCYVIKQMKLKIYKNSLIKQLIFWQKPTI